MTEEELRSFLDDRWIVQVATAGPQGRPHLVPLWYVPAAGPELRCWTYAASQKARNLERDPRATCSIDDGVRYEALRGVMMECDVQLERDPERVAGYGVEIFERYGPGGALAPELRALVERQAAKRVGLCLKPTRTVSWDHRKLGAAQ